MYEKVHHRGDYYRQLITQLRVKLERFRVFFSEMIFLSLLSLSTPYLESWTLNWSDLYILLCPPLPDVTPCSSSRDKLYILTPFERHGGRINKSMVIVAIFIWFRNIKEIEVTNPFCSLTLINSLSRYISSSRTLFLCLPSFSLSIYLSLYRELVLLVARLILKKRDKACFKSGLLPNSSI